MCYNVHMNIYSYVFTENVNNGEHLLTIWKGPKEDVMKHTAIEPWDADGMAEFFKVLSDKTRVRILAELLSGSLCVMHISERVGMSQSAISHQLAILRRANLVRVTRKGKMLVYAISDEHVRLLLDMAILHLNEEARL